MASPQVRSKAWGYAVEVAAKKALERLFPGIARTGSVAYTEAAADLVRPGTRHVHDDVPLARTISIKDIGQHRRGVATGVSGTRSVR